MPGFAQISTGFEQGATRRRHGHARGEQTSANLFNTYDILGRRYNLSFEWKF
ncbi:hypothetical protein [Lysobacter enzymogenes]|uniref:hypothetical protein n=1 Tax=Lysobacter enzymogenes TaxID=69 RepID=UPI001AFB9106|nr:hypothetical protein [Lysobacter enzymogenes]QQQ01387.1 hypothetical protein JHW41_25695 [Lysobacter enzymogenes]